MTATKDRTILKLKPEEGVPYSVDWSPDGTQLVVGDYNGGVVVWTAEGKRLWRCVEHSGSVRGISWAPNGQQIASASFDNTIRVYDAVSSKVVLRGDAGTGNWKITWSPDSSRLAWVVGDDNTSFVVRIVDASSGLPLLDCSGHTRIVWCVLWSPTGNMLASGSNDTTIRLWDVTTGSCMFCLEGHHSAINDLCWSPDSGFLASASHDKTLRVWNTKTGTCLFRCEGHKDSVCAVSWSPDGSVLASGSSDHSVRLWSADSGTPLLILKEHTENVISVAFSPDGDKLASVSYDGTVRIWDVSDFMQVSSTPLLDTALIAYVARQVATIGYQMPKIKKRPVWVPHFPGAEGNCLGVLKGPVTEKKVSSVAMFPDGHTIVTGSGKGILRRWDLRTGQPLWQGSEKHGSCINDVAVSPGGQTIASASGDNTVGIWNAASGQKIRQCEGHTSQVVKVRWSPDGQRLASLELSNNKQLRIWDAHSGVFLFLCEGHKVNTQALSWSPNGQFIASGDNAGDIRIWASDSGHCLKQFNDYQKTIWGICWSPDNQYLLVGYKDGTVLVIDASDGSLRFRCDGHKNGVSALDWSPDGRLLAAQSGETEKTITVWDAYTGKGLKWFLCQDSCFRLVWSPDGGFIVSSHKYDIFRFWDTRDLLPVDTAPVQTKSQPIPAALRLLPAALAQILRINIYPPLSWVRDLLDLTAGKSEVESLKSLVPQYKSLQSLIDLHWPYAARVGLVALLLFRLPLTDWQPPQPMTLVTIREALTQALGGASIPPIAPAPPISLLHEVLGKIDNRFISLLTMLGPEAVAADPGLPIRLLPRISEIPPLNAHQRRLLGVRVGVPGISGQSTGTAPGVERGNVGDIEMGPLRPDWVSLLPTQLAMPRWVQIYRHWRGELLFRAREMAEPPRLRPVVILLDVSPPCFGPIEKITRLAAYTIAQSLRQAGLRVILLTTSEGVAGREWVLELIHPADLLEIWVQRTLKLSQVSRSLKLAEVLRAGLRESDGLEPVIVVLSHPWFGAEEEIPKIKGLRGLFVQYPGQTHTPILSTICEKWRSIEANQASNLSQILGSLLT